MAILGIVLGIIGVLAALLAALMGILGGIPAAILGLLAGLFGFLAWKKSRKGISSIVIGSMAVVLAVVMTISGINSAKFHYDQVKAHPEKAPTLAMHLDDAKLEYGIIGLMLGSKTPEEDKVLTEEVIALIQDTLPKAAAAETTVPAV